MNDKSDLTVLYKLREDFTIIALTGRIGAGYGKIAQQLELGFGDGSNFPTPSKFKLNHNSYRKYRIVYNYAKHNFKPFQKISYRNVLILFILKDGFEHLINFLTSSQLSQSFQEDNLDVVCEFKHEIEELKTLRTSFDEFRAEFLEVDLKHLKIDNNFEKLYDIFFNAKFSDFCNKFCELFDRRSIVKQIKVFQVISNNLRETGTPYHSKDIDPNNIFTVVEIINDLIKAYKIKQGDASTKIVIDRLKNPLEIMFFRQRFAAFYLIAISKEDEKREDSLRERYKEAFEDISRMAEDEYKTNKGNQFFKPFVRECIEKADIHIGFKTIQEVDALNCEQEVNNDNTSPFFSWEMQLLKYIALINHPGLVTPSPEERCMQLAITAKYNSGCISRQVGAAITDENYSVKAVGWNNTPEGQVPCNLRNTEDLLIDSGDIDAFTPYEREDNLFKKALTISFPLNVIQNESLTKGKNVCFCFKSLKNSYSEGKNQVHTRSLHAEESAFLQITKYGGTGIKNGKLFTTASPCELCSKKAYQLGIKVIYYIDPYPGISQKQILEAGSTPPNVRLFNGAIGNAYNWLYEPLMNYKDEQSLVFKNDLQDLASKQKTIITEQQERIKQLEAQIEELSSKQQ